MKSRCFWTFVLKFCYFFLKEAILNEYKTILMEALIRRFSHRRYSAAFVLAIVSRQVYAWTRFVFLSVTECHVDTLKYTKISHRTL